MADFNENIKQYASRIAAHNTPEARGEEFGRIFEEIKDLTFGVAQPVRDELIRRILRDLKEELFRRGFPRDSVALEKRGGLEWLIESNSVGNEEAIELMRMVSKGFGK